MMGRMKQRLAEIPVGCKEQQARGIEVETTDGKQAGIPIDGNELGDGRAPMGVAHRGDVAARFVEHDVGSALPQNDRDAVDGDRIDCRVDLAAQLGGDDAVHTDTAGSHEVFGTAAAGHPRASEKTLQAHGDQALIRLERGATHGRLRRVR